MDKISLSFVRNLVLVLMTSFIMTFYIFRTSTNQCQMTFMMEPPKFIPVPVGEDDSPVLSTGYESQNNQLHSNYKLFMYSEIGFPSTSDVRKDLKDSMPVLFVPGNAGSYQQVRSLASTCIRKQLKSLDAFKFIFYTIDFGGQLSGIDGLLIENQISFVHKALKQISSMHPPETNGTILIGHSIGGFITKALLADSRYKSTQVPLLINLASPLTSSYINFDYVMYQLYQRTNERWMQRDVPPQTISISISGGRSDRLVPMHLSLDHTYDLALATSSIKDVWFTTDHVCITWCRELMHKLANLLSAVMDKKRTSLISDRQLAMSTILGELLTDSPIKSVNKQNVIIKDSKTFYQSSEIATLEKSFKLTRKQLADEFSILNVTSECEDIVIAVEHIDNLKTNTIYGCQDLRPLNSNGQMHCSNLIDLVDNSRRIPTRRYELHRTIIIVPKHASNYLIFNFNSRSHASSKVPESITVSTVDVTTEFELQVPSLAEFFIRKLFLFETFRTNIARRKESSELLFLRYRLTNLIYSTQFYLLNLEPQRCIEAQATESVVLYMRQNSLIESFHQEKNAQNVIIKIDSHQSIVGKSLETRDQSAHLEIYTNAGCDHHLTVDIDLWSLIEYLIKTQIGHIILLSTYMAYISLARHSLALGEPEAGAEKSLFDRYTVFSFLGCVLLYNRTIDRKLDVNQLDRITDATSQFLLVFVLANGALAFSEYLFKRIVDLATITQRLQVIIKEKVFLLPTQATKLNGKDLSNGCSNSSLNSVRICAFQSNYEWVALVLTILVSLIFSEAVITLATLLIVVKFASAVNEAFYKQHSHIDCATGSCSDQRKTISNESGYDRLFKLSVDLANLCALNFVANVPALLLSITKSNSVIPDLATAKANIHLGSAVVSLILMQLVCKSLRLSLAALCEPKLSRCHPERLTWLPLDHMHYLLLIPILSTYNDIRNINLVLAAALVWLKCK